MAGQGGGEAAERPGIVRRLPRLLGLLLCLCPVHGVAACGRDEDEFAPGQVTGIALLTPCNSTTITFGLEIIVFSDTQSGRILTCDLQVQS